MNRSAAYAAVVSAARTGDQVAIRAALAALDVTPWLTPEEVAEYADVAYPDDRIDLCTEAVRWAVEERRSDLNYNAPVRGDVHAGAIMWATILYQSRNAPSGFTGYGDQSTLYDSLGARRAEVMRLIGYRNPVVA